MKPISYTGNDENCVFHYSFKDLREFITEHRKSGAAGRILIKKEGITLFYKCSGTIENPLKSEKLLTFMVRILENFTGKLEIDNIMNPKSIFDNIERFVMMPLNKDKQYITYKRKGNYARRFIIPANTLKDGDVINIESKFKNVNLNNPITPELIQESAKAQSDYLRKRIKNNNRK